MRVILGNASFRFVIGAVPRLLHDFGWLVGDSGRAALPKIGRAVRDGLSARRRLPQRSRRARRHCHRCRHLRHRSRRQRRAPPTRGRDRSRGPLGGGVFERAPRAAAGTSAGTTAEPREEAVAKRAILNAGPAQPSSGPPTMSQLDASVAARIEANRQKALAKLAAKKQQQSRPAPTTTHTARAGSMPTSSDVSSTPARTSLLPSKQARGQAGSRSGGGWRGGTRTFRCAGRPYSAPTGQT